jgi:hypothetical protein
MTEHEASRTLVKSPPELWAQCSAADSLARHLGQFGEIRITRLEPETTVAWEGTHASGTVTLEPSGWGTRVILTANAVMSEDPAEPSVSVTDGPPRVVDDGVPEPAVALQPEPEPAPEPPVPEKRGFFARLFGRRRPVPPEPAPVAVEPESEPVATEPQPVVVAPEVLAPEVVAPEVVAPDAAPDPEPAPAPTGLDHASVLTAALDSLGQAHHRPFSRG